MPKQKTVEQALNSLMTLCSKAEKSTGDALRLMTGWQIEPTDRQKVLERLIADRYIDNRRYAEAYTREKTNLNGWGEHKIRLNLRMKGVENDIIEEVLSEIDPEQNRAKLEQLLQKKSTRIVAPDVYNKRAKLIRYALSLGYDYSLVRSVIDSLEE